MEITEETVPETIMETIVEAPVTEEEIIEDTISFEAKNATSLPTSVYLQQQNSVTCTLASATMMI